MALFILFLLSFLLLHAPSSSKLVTTDQQLNYMSVATVLFGLMGWLSNTIVHILNYFSLNLIPS